MGYRERLAALDYTRSYAATPAQARVALLTGQSSFQTSRLSAAQRDFLQKVAPEGAAPLLAGFPYHPDFHRDCVQPGLASASVRNGLQFLWSLYSARFRQLVARALQPLLTNTRERLYLVTGSCGLQLLAGAWRLLIVPPALRLRIVALGPVALGPLRVDARVLQGRKDVWSRCLYGGPVTSRCAGGHLDYWQSVEVRAEVARLLGEGDQ